MPKKKEESESESGSESGSESSVSSSSSQSSSSSDERHKKRSKPVKKQHKKGKRHHKKKKDPNAPKKPKTGYICFTQKKREEAKAALPAGAPASSVMTKLGEMWKELTVEAKKPYEDEAKADKDRYDAEMKKYVPPAAAESSSSGSESDKPKKKKKKKDPHAPKKPKSAYLFFGDEVRPEITKELKEKLGSEFKVTSVLSEIGKRWKALTDKKKYEALADAAKKQYEIDVKAYDAKKADS